MEKPTNNQFAEFEEYEDFSKLNINNLVTEIWVKPTLVFKYLFKTNPEKYLWILMILAGISSSLDNYLTKTHSYVNTSYSLGYLLGVIVFGALFGWISFYIFGWILSIFGSGFLNGHAKPKEFRTVLAWGSIPSTSSIILTILLAIVYGTNSLSSDNISNEIEAYIFIVVGLMQIGLGIWGVIIITHGIKLIQKFSFGKALLNLLLPFIILVIILGLIFFLTEFL